VATPSGRANFAALQPRHLSDDTGARHHGSRTAHCDAVPRSLIVRQVSSKVASIANRGLVEAVEPERAVRFERMGRGRRVRTGPARLCASAALRLNAVNRLVGPGEDEPAQM
jgi:hypothetical protein